METTVKSYSGKWEYVLTASYLGYSTQKVSFTAMGGDITQDIVLAEDLLSLDEGGYRYRNRGQ